MIYSIESAYDVQEEISPLLQAAWDEVDQLAEHMELDVDWEMYQKLEDVDMLKLYTARTEEGELVGFVCMHIQPIMHSKGNYHALTDTSYVKPEHRGDFKTFLNLIEEDLTEEGVVWFSITLKAWDKRGKFLEDMGFTDQEHTYQKKVN